jgi:alpha-glucosidase
LRYQTDDVEKLPMFVRGGAIIPFAKERNWFTPGEQDSTLTLEVYALESAEFTLYEDDGKTLAYQKGAYSTTLFTADTDSAGVASVKINKTQGDFPGKLSEKSYVIKVFTPGKPFQSVRWNGARLRRETAAQDFSAGGWYFNPAEKMTYLWVKVQCDIGGTVVLE